MDGRGRKDVAELRVRSGALSLSGLRSEPIDQPARGLVVALHGGGSSSGYWNCPVDGASLLDLGARIGFEVLALDRPGYGASRDFDPARLDLASQAELVFDAIDAWLARRGDGGPVFLIGHSVGAILALVMGGHPRGCGLTAIDALGAPFRYPATADSEAIQSLAAAGHHTPPLDEAIRRAVLFGPPETWDEAALAFDRGCGRPMPVAEYRDGLAAPGLWARLLPSIPVPVRFGLAEFESMQATGQAVLAEVQALLTGHPLSVTHLQRGSGHNVSQHRVARAYHLAALAFFEQALAMGRSNPGT